MTLPLMSEFLNNEEYRDFRSNKQDCERKAFYRLSERIKKRFPKLKVSVTMDGLYACGPVIKVCREYGWDYMPVSYTHLRAHETRHDLVCRLLLEKKNIILALTF